MHLNYLSEVVGVNKWTRNTKARSWKIKIWNETYTHTHTHRDNTKTLSSCGLLPSDSP